MSNYNLISYVEIGSSLRLNFICCVGIFLIIFGITFLSFIIEYLKKKQKIDLIISIASGTIVMSAICFEILIMNGYFHEHYPSGRALSTVFIFYDDYQNTLITYSELNMSDEEIENISTSSIKMTITIPEINQSVEYNFSHNSEGIIINQMWRGILGIRGEVSLEIDNPKYEYYYSILIQIIIESNNTELNKLSLIGNENNIFIKFKINKTDDNIYFQNLGLYKEEQNRFGKWFIIEHELHFAITKQYIYWD